ncbi:MAG: hypothetical protein AABN34_06730 [Acidobacteriota bacterium]
MDIPESIRVTKYLIKESSKGDDSVVGHYLNAFKVGPTIFPWNWRCRERYLRNKPNALPYHLLVERAKLWRAPEVVSVVRMVSVRRIRLVHFFGIVGEEGVGSEVRGIFDHFPIEAVFRF